MMNIKKLIIHFQIIHIIQVNSDLIFLKSFYHMSNFLLARQLHVLYCKKTTIPRLLMVEVFQALVLVAGLIYQFKIT